MIVMVILLVGIMTAIRIFPIGLSVNKSAEKITLSSALANEVQDSYLSDPDSIMDNVVAVTPVPLQEASGTVTEFEENTNVSPYDLGPGVTYPGFANTYLSDPYFAADVNKIHRVIGERAPIPPTPTDYFLKCGPFLDTKWDGMTRSLFIYGNPLYRNHQLVYDSNGNVTAPNVNGRMYAIDYGEANTPPSIAFYPSIKYNQFFLITYVTIGADGLRHRIVDQIVYVPAVPPLPSPPNPPNTIPPAVWQPLATVGTIVPYSETVSRMFVDQGNLPFDSDNPYEYELVSPSYQSSSDPMLAANIGEILLNPAGYHYGEGSPNGSQYLEAHIDYDVFDWHILHEDRFMPSSAPYTIRLGLTNIKKIGEMQSDQTKYTGLFYDVGNQANPTPDILVYDMNTGSQVNPQSVDYLNGTITFSPADGLADATHTLRIYYQAHGSWAIQILKSSNVYSGSGGVPPAMGEFFVRGNRIYFPRCDMGKTVRIGDLYYLEPNPSNPANPYHRHSTEEAYQISSTVDPVVGFPYVDITTVHPDTLGLDMNVNGTGYSPFPVQNVQGVSFDVRVIHNNGATVNQTPNGNVTSVQWIKYDLDTILSRTNP